MSLFNRGIKCKFEIVSSYDVSNCVNILECLGKKKKKGATEVEYHESKTRPQSQRGIDTRINKVFAEIPYEMAVTHRLWLQKKITYTSLQLVLPSSQLHSESSRSRNTISGRMLAGYIWVAYLWPSCRFLACCEVFRRLNILAGRMSQWLDIKPSYQPPSPHRECETLLKHKTLQGMHIFAPPSVPSLLHAPRPSSMTGCLPTVCRIVPT